MNRKTLLLVYCIGMLFLVEKSIHAETQKYSVVGTVSSAEGSPIPNALVTAIPVAQGTAGSTTWVRTNSVGKFRLTLSPGKYVIRAKSEADGYPDPNFLLSADVKAIFPEVSVRSSDISDVKVTLADKGGILEGSLVDKDTRAPVPGKITIRDARKPEAFVELSADAAGRFRFVVPAKPIVIIATAPGYEEQLFEGGRELTLCGAEQRNIQVELKHK